MKKEYQLNEDEFAEIKAISAQREPVMKFGNYWTGTGPQDRANAFWKLLGDKHGFIWDTAEPVSGKGHMFFKATPKPEVKIEMEAVAKVTHEYVTKGPNLYMRQYWPEGSRDCWLANYGTDFLAKEAADRWNDRTKEFGAASAQQEGGRE